MSSAYAMNRFLGIKTLLSDIFPIDFMIILPGKSSPLREHRSIKRTLLLNILDSMASVSLGDSSFAG